MARPRTNSSASADAWVAKVEAASAIFLDRFGSVYTLSDRALSGIFEIGCFLTIVADYERQGIAVQVSNLIDGTFRYLTTPNGNPHNFSHVRLSTGSAGWELRQQVRVCSHVQEDIYFTPDIVVLCEGAEIRTGKDRDYAKGKRSFFRVNATSVVAAHECKSMTGFPELYVSFIGMFLMGHAWSGDAIAQTVARQVRGHLAPSLFVGSEVSNLHRRMVTALESRFPINFVTGLHRGGWNLGTKAAQANRLPFEAVPVPAVASAGNSSG